MHVPFACAAFSKATDGVASTRVAAMTADAQMGGAAFVATGYADQGARDCAHIDEDCETFAPLVVGRFRQGASHAGAADISSNTWSAAQAAHETRATISADARMHAGRTMGAGVAQFGNDASDMSARHVAPAEPDAVNMW
ncbi:hypothetical protein LJR230_003133 [Trinickia sp. LjRoot230]|uniref:hypothetical protein n=1 Tax=Trinickia sp. LjRoot230 TaxID=3342288 RepID=UPI003ECE8829